MLDYEEMVRKTLAFLDDEEAQNARLPAELRRQLATGPCEQVPTAFGEFGRSLTNPIPVNGLLGELTYLSQLQTTSGIPVCFHRIGSFNSVDIFETYALDGGKWDVLYLSLYFQKKSRKLPTGYQFDSASPTRRLLKGTTLEVGDFPKYISNAAVECCERILNVRLVDMRLKFLEDAPLRSRPSAHQTLIDQIKIHDKSFLGAGGGVQSFFSNNENDVILTAYETLLDQLEAGFSHIGEELSKIDRDGKSPERSTGFHEEISYLALNIMIPAIFATASPGENPSAIADRLLIAALRPLANGGDVLEYRRRFELRWDSLRKLDWMFTKEKFNQNEVALLLGTWLTTDNCMLTGHLIYGLATSLFTDVVQQLTARDVRP